MGKVDPVFPATAMPDTDWWQTLWPAPRDIILALGVETHMDTVDLCCGDGWFTAPLALIARHVHAIDIDERMLEQTKKQVVAIGAANCEFLRADAYDVASIVPRPVDFVLLANTFHGVPAVYLTKHASPATPAPGRTANQCNSPPSGLQGNPTAAPRYARRYQTAM